MVVAPHSCRVATNGTPPARNALVTSKLPLPITPNACAAPSSANVRPTSSATFTAPPRRRVCRRDSPLYQRIHPSRAAGAADDRQRRDDQHRAAGREPRQVLQLCQAELSGAQQEVVARERRGETRGGGGGGGGPRR